MGQFIRANGDYNIKTIDGGTIKLDTGPNVGRVLVTGDLVVQGNTTAVDSIDLNVRDNIIIANFGETGDGVTLIYSGLQIDRGYVEGTYDPETETGIPNSPASIIFNENPTGDSYWQIATGIPGSYNFQDSRLKVNEILTEPAGGTNPNGNLSLIGPSSPNGVITVSGTINYEDQVIDDDDIPNKRYVDLAILNNPAFQIKLDDTRVIISDKELPESLAFYTDVTNGLTTDDESAVSLLVDGALVAEFRENQAYIQDLKITGNTIAINDQTTSDDENIKFATFGTTGKVEFDDAIQLKQRQGPFSIISDYTLLHGGAAGVGTTGLYYVNDSAESHRQSGELISKSRALLFSILF